MRILILSPHTDDAELGCGGSIVKFINEKHDFFWIVFSTAKESLPEKFPENTLAIEYSSVMQDLGINNDYYKILDFNVRNLFRYRQEILEDLIKIRNQFNPNLVIGPSLNDFHQDHQIVANEMIRAFKTTSSIISYELPWNHVTFNSQCFIKLQRADIERKYSLLKKYKSQIDKGRAYFSEEYVFGLAKTRGIQCNSEYAEAFEVVRWML